MDHVMLHRRFYPFATHHTGHCPHANGTDPALSEGLPLVTALVGDTDAPEDPTPGSARCTVLTWDATRVARCARGSAERASVSSGCLLLVAVPQLSGAHDLSAPE